MTLNVHTGRMDLSELESPSSVEQQAAAWQAVWQTLQDVDPNFAAQTGSGKEMVLNSIRGLADRIAQLESELVAVGAGGVQRLDKQAVQQTAPFMWAIQSPDGSAYMDENCVSTLWENVRAEVDGLNSGLDADDGLFKVVPVFLAATQPAAQGTDSRDAAFEAVRKAFCKVQRYSFSLDSRGNLRRCADHCGNWVEFEAVHTLFEPQSVDAALAAQAKHGDDHG